MVRNMQGVDYAQLGPGGAQRLAMHAGEQHFRYLSAAGLTAGSSLCLMVCQLTDDGELPAEPGMHVIGDGEKYAGVTRARLAAMRQFATNRGGDAVPEHDLALGGAFRTLAVIRGSTAKSATLVAAAAGDTNAINRTVAEAMIGVAAHCWQMCLQASNPS